MLISCPACAAAYEVPDHLLSGAGQALRCARCLHEWVGVTPPPVVVTMSAPVPAFVPGSLHAAYPEMPPPGVPLEQLLAELPRPPRRRTLALAGAWTLSVVVLVLLGFGAVRWRGEVMAAWPPSERAYALVGLR